MAGLVARGGGVVRTRVADADTRRPRDVRPRTAVVSAAAGAASAEPRPVPAGGAPSGPSDEGLHVIKSPIVGTFYRARDPNTPAFVEVGDRVKIGQVLCIIEAMKMMNEIESEVAGEVVRVHRENGQPVQYGEPLFAIRS